MEPSNSPNPSTSSFQLGNYEVRLTLNDIQLVIDAEDSSLRRFQLILKADNVQELTSSIFDDLQFLHVGLLEAFEGKNPSIKVDISDDGMLTYSEEQVLRGLKRVKKFTLALKEEVMDESKRQARRLDLQANKIVELEARIAKLEKENNQLKSDSEKALIEKIENIEKIRIPEVEEANNRIVNKLEEVFGKKIEKIEKEAIPQVKQAIEKTLQDFERRINLLDIEKRIDEKLMQLNSSKLSDKLSFDPNCPHAGKFSFSNENKTITYQGQSQWFACIPKNPLQKQQKTKFCVRADSISSGNIMIGICPVSLKSTANIYSQSGVYCYYGSSTGHIYINGGGTQLSNNGYKTGSEMSLIVDLANNTIIFELNGSQIYSTSLDSSKIASNDYYPFVELFNQNDKVSFV